MTGDIDKARAILGAARGRGARALSEAEAKAVLACFGLNVPRGAFVPAGVPAGETLAGLRYPVVAKVASAAILHKSDVGGVRLGLGSPEAVAAAIAEMDRSIRAAGHAVEGWHIEEMVEKGVEVVIGGAVDVRFGPTVMVGLGGVLVELLEDVSFGICPITPGDARRMLDELKGVRLLRGFRGAAPANEAAVIAALLAVGGEGGLMTSLADLVGELDINPLIVSRHGAVAADARILPRLDLAHAA